VTYDTFNARIEPIVLAVALVSTLLLFAGVNHNYRSVLVFAQQQSDEEEGGEEQEEKQSNNDNNDDNEEKDKSSIVAVEDIAVVSHLQSNGSSIFYIKRVRIGTRRYILIMSDKNLSHWLIT
jgi:hypothetical protein